VQHVSDTATQVRAAERDLPSEPHDLSCLLLTKRYAVHGATQAWCTARPDGFVENANMFAVDPVTADAIRQAFNKEGELAAVVEFRRHYPLLANNENARSFVHAIAGWQSTAPLLPSLRRAKKTCPERNVQE